MNETKKRSITKTITWRIIALSSTFIITYLFLGSFQQSLVVTILLNVTAIILYYIHERVWNLINWERKVGK